jgi:hypothetical protein
MFQKYFLWAVLLLVVLVRFSAVSPHFVNGQLLRISGVLYSEPSTVGQNIKFNLSGMKVTAKKDDVHYGDSVIVEGLYKEGSVSGEIKQIKTSTSIFTTIRKKIISFYESALPKTSASLVGGITIGAKSNLPRTFSNNLRATGTSHIVVASGMNISMVGEFVLSILLLLLSRRKALLATVILFGDIHSLLDLKHQ